MLKIFIIITSLSFVACSQIPEFPDLDPITVYLSRDKAFQCHLVDKKNAIVQCDRVAQPVKDLLQEGSSCTGPKQTNDVFQWFRITQDYVSKHCSCK